MKFAITLFIVLATAAPNQAVRFGFGPLGASQLEAAEADAWGKSLTLKRLVERVRQANPEIEAAQAEAEAAKAQASAAFSWEAPRLSYELMGAPDGDFSQPGVKRWELTQELPFLGRSWLKSRAARKAAASSEAMARLNIEDKVYEAKSAYWRLAADLRLQQVAEDLVARLGKLSNRSGERGNFGRLDRMGQVMDHMAGSMAAEMEGMLIHQRQEVLKGKAMLRRLAGEGNPRESARELPDPSGQPEDILGWSEASLAKLREAALTQNPMLEAARAEAARAQAALTLARTGWLPDLMLEAGWEENAMGMREGSLKAGISLPWIWWGMQAGDNSMASAEARAAAAMLRDAEARIEEEILVLQGEWATGRDELRLAYEKSAPRALKAVEAATSGYASGQVELREALDAVMNEWKVEERLAHTWWHAGDARAALERLTAQESAKGEKP